MQQTIALALKDLKLLLRDKLGAFFIIGFPILMGLFFGLVMGGQQSGGGGKMKVALVDLDQSPQSAKFRESLSAIDGVELEAAEEAPAKESVRLGKRTAMVVVPKGYGETAGLLWMEQPEIGVGVDPSRTAEAAMLEGMIMQATATLIGDRFQEPLQILPSIQAARQSLLDETASNPAIQLLAGGFFDQLEGMVKSADQLQKSESPGEGGAANPGFEMNFARIGRIDVTREVDPKSIQGQLSRRRSAWDISFPQAMLWGVLGSVAGFSLSIARERSQGTLLRLRSAPLSKLQILLGKALACFMTCVFVILFMTVLGLLLGMRPESFVKLAAAGLVTSFCFVGIMMTLSVLGKTEESVGGIGWAANMVMAMLGGAMIPVMFMPGFLQKLSVISPIRWAILLIEGAIWRGFSWSEMGLAIAILLGIGATGLLIGTAILAKRQD